MEKFEYIRECQKRNQSLKDDILNFHKTFPPVFSPIKDRGGLDEKGNRIVYKDFPQLPDWLKHRMERVLGRNAYIGRPRSLDDMVLFNGMSIQNEGFAQVFPDEAGGRYFESIGETPAKWVIAFDNLCKKWPRVDRMTLRWGIFKPYRPPMVTPSHPFEIEKWEKDLANLAHAVKIVIPIYEDTSKDDIEVFWKQIVSLQADLYETKRRTATGKYELKLKVWDEYQKVGNFVQVSKALNMRRTTVMSLYDSVDKDIKDFLPTGAPKGRKALEFDAKSHVSECSQCQNAKSFEQMCKKMRDVTDQDYVPQRELTVGLTPEYYGRSQRKKTTSYV